MKGKIFKIFILSIALILVFGSIGVSAFTPYETYTYSINGKPLKSPAAYTADKSVTASDLKLESDYFGSNLTDLFADYEGRVYITDASNGRIIIANEYLNNTIKVIETYVDEYGVERKFNAPQGVYCINPEESEAGKNLPVEERDFLYVCDMDPNDQSGRNNRIVIFNENYEYVRTLYAPTNAPALINAKSFLPKAVAVDKYGRIFVICSGSYRGVVVLSSDGDFTGYIGAQKVTSNFFEEIWKMFQSDAQKASAVKKLSYAFNNITIDDNGFVYVTTDNIKEAQQFGAIRSKSADFSPVKKLNSTGVQIMKRNGFFDPGGEVDILKPDEVSKINDVALGNEGTWTIVDYSRSRYFTYDQDGNLLFAFGDKVSGADGQLGNASDIRAITYQVGSDGIYHLLALDYSSANGFSIISYAPTVYYDALMLAIHNQDKHNYNLAIDNWQSVLDLNENFDLAYIGIGKAYYGLGEYEKAYEYLQLAYETQYASKAFDQMSSARMENPWIMVAIIAGVILLLVLFVKFLGYAKKKNKATALKVGKKTYWEELLYAFHLVFHPFDGFWDLKHEKRGSVRAGSTILLLTIIASCYNTVGKGYLYAPNNDDANIFAPIGMILGIVFLWTIANWCLTTLFDGEGSFKDIYIATCYSLAPMPLFSILSTVLTNVMSLESASIVSMLGTIGTIWTVILIFFGMMVTHDYSIKKNIITMLGTILAIVIIIFIAMLFINLVMQIITFVASIIQEVGTRL